MEEVLIPLALFLTIFAIVYVIYTTRNKERLALIERGADAKMFKTGRKLNPYDTFKWGLFMIGVAIGTFIGALFERYSELPTPPMYISMVLVFGGLGLIISYLMRGRLIKTENE